uniref:C-type lectin domain-containing protein n=1 Tax=Panagrolaimus sp. ES5 TaxID=591445 RepID=A0AC34F1Q5_9BILA
MSNNNTPKVVYFHPKPIWGTYGVPDVYRLEVKVIDTINFEEKYYLISPINLISDILIKAKELPLENVKAVLFHFMHNNVEKETAIAKLLESYYKQFNIQVFCCSANSIFYSTILQIAEEEFGDIGECSSFVFIRDDQIRCVTIKRKNEQFYPFKDNSINNVTSYFEFFDTSDLEKYITEAKAFVYFHKDQPQIAATEVQIKTFMQISKPLMKTKTFLVLTKNPNIHSNKTIVAKILNFLGEENSSMPKYNVACLTNTYFGLVTWENWLSNVPDPNLYFMKNAIIHVGQMEILPIKKTFICYEPFQKLMCVNSQGRQFQGSIEPAVPKIGLAVTFSVDRFLSPHISVFHPVKVIESAVLIGLRNESFSLEVIKNGKLESIDLKIPMAISFANETVVVGEEALQMKEKYNKFVVTDLLELLKKDDFARMQPNPERGFTVLKNKEKTQNFIVFETFRVFADSDAQNVDCGGEGWSYYPPTGFCYGVKMQSKVETWQNAENICKSLNAHLVTINSLAEYQQIMSWLFFYIFKLIQCFLIGYFSVTFGNTWTGYYTPSVTSYDPSKWISVDGSGANFLKYGRWCNVFRWGVVVNPAGGKRCLAIGYDQEKPCFFDVECNGITMLPICKRAPKTPVKSASEVLFEDAESPIAAVAGTKECGDGFSYFPPSGLCYGVGTMPPRITWQNAEKYCQSMGGHLFTINSLEEYRHFASYFYIIFDNTWTGYYTPSGTTFDATKWIGVDGKAAGFLKHGKWCNTFRWGTHVQPVGGKRCLGFGFDQQKPCFFDVDCTGLTMKSICQRPPKTTEIALKSEIPILSEYNCGEGWTYFSATGFCYGMKQLPPAPATWQNAESVCQSLGGHLVTVNSLDEYQQFMSYVYVGSFGNTWAGYSTPSGTTFDATKWIGVDGKEANFLKYGKWCNTFRWGIHVAPSAGKRCLGVGYDQVKPCFFDVECDGIKMQIICKRSPKASEKVISEVLFEPDLSVETAVVSNAESHVECGDGWSYFPPSGFCYGVNSLPARSTWTNAENYCQSLGGHLVTFNSIEEFRHFSSYFYIVFDNTWTGYYTPSGTTYDARKWIGVDGIEANFLKYGRWCNMYRWTQWINPVRGKRCLAMGYDQEKPCLFEHDCTSITMRIICKRPPKTQPTTKIIVTKTAATIQPTKNSLTIPTVAVIPRNTCHV